jgi:hypothetical protein
MGGPERLNGLGLWEGLAAQGVATELDRFLPLTQQVMDQTRRRVLEGESAPADEKIFSIFEAHRHHLQGQPRHLLWSQNLSDGWSVLNDPRP